MNIRRANQRERAWRLGNLRAVVIIIVVAFHASLAYLGSLTGAAFPFDDPPFKWRAFPIVDSHRFLGLDVFCAWQDVYLMSLMFFLSALFTWPSLSRKGGTTFLADRFLRLGLPFIFAVAVVVPIAEYPAYRVTAADPGVMAYTQHLLALPFWPNGPMWFLWQLLTLTIVAAGLHRFVPNWVAALGRASASAHRHPGRYFAGLVTVAVAAYVPMALAFTPWSWSMSGPLSLQFSRPLLYTGTLSRRTGRRRVRHRARASRIRRHVGARLVGLAGRSARLVRALDGIDRTGDALSRRRTTGVAIHR